MRKNNFDIWPVYSTIAIWGCLGFDCYKTAMGIFAFMVAGLLSEIKGMLEDNPWDRG